MPAPYDKVALVLSIDKVVTVTDSTRGVKKGHCIACGATGILKYRYGTLWRPRERGDQTLVHLYYCPVNRILINQKQ